MTSRSLRSVAGIVVALVATTGCVSTPRPSVDIGMNRVGLTRAFTDERLKPLAPQVLFRLLPPQAQTGMPPDLAPIDLAPPAAPPTDCPKAPADATVAAAAPLVIAGTPAPGFYRLHNEGTIKLTAATLSFAVPYPPDTYVQVSDVKQVDVSTVPGLNVAPKKRTQFTLTTTIAPTYFIKEVFQYDANRMDLVSRSETNNGVVSSDDWTPAVEVYDTGGVGSSWQGIATDVQARRTMTDDGKITKKVVVDACGTLLEAVQAETRTTVVDIATRNTSGTTTGKTDIARVATSLGGLFATRENHTTATVVVDNVPVTIVVDVTSTLVDLTPKSGPPT